LDLADFMESPPPHLDETDFRRSWPLLEWENKIVIGPLKMAPSTGDEQILSALLTRLLSSIGGGLACITPGYGLAEGGAYLAANMHARSVFSEEVLGNICLERSSAADGLVIAGHARLRSRSQGIAVALGDKISLFFKSL
jgi:coatomer subunit beta